MLLKAVAQSYDWGKLGDESKVAELLKQSGQEVDEKKPYAELWMGTHPNGPSKIAEEGKDLGEYLKENESAAGEVIRQVWPDGDGLPYLFKILSIRKALSVQAHPDKRLAEKLFKDRPDLYKDPNHKPELAMAITKMEAMCGFRKISEISSFLKQVPELSEAVGKERAEKFHAVTDDSSREEKAEQLRSIFDSLMHQKPEHIETQVTKLIERLKGGAEAQGELKKVCDLAVRLDQQFPKDIGIFSAFLLNFIVLEPGQAMFLAANEPHAYISGDCAECMACSDNVVRAGLTPKFKDVDTLVDMLTYNCGPIDILEGEEEDSNTRLYRPPIKEFLLHHTRTKNSAKLSSNNTGSILLAYEGEATLNDGKKEEKVKSGDVLFIPAGVEVKVDTSAQIGLLRCSCNC